MAQFNATFTKSSTDCKTLVITDTSNYGYFNNDEHYDITRFNLRLFIVRDSLGNELARYDLGTTILSVDFDLSNLPNTTFVNIDIELVVGIPNSGSYTNRSLTNLLPCILP